MSIIEALRVLILGPLELLMDVVFSFATELMEKPGLSIVVLSFVVNILLLPLYLRADAIQKQEREVSRRLKPGIDLIKEAFTGDERFMILQTYYRQNHYKPWYVLRSSISLLLQIPFFMAAYDYLSHLQVIQGISFGMIRDLGKPDGMLVLGGTVINVLPVLMTVINLVSGVIYTRGFPLKSKIQTYGLTLLFLVLLYQSPSALVLYWTLNNFFSLCKNAVAKLKNPKRFVAFASSIVGLLFTGFVLLHFRDYEAKRSVLLLAVSLVFQLPVIIWLFQRKHSNKKEITEDRIRRNRAVFFTCAMVLTILTGLLIPSAVIHSSPAEFVEVGHYQSPLLYVLRTFLMAVGTFLIWFGIYFLLTSKDKQGFFSLAAAIIASAALMNYMFFGSGYGTMSSLLQYGLDLPISSQQKLINLACNIGLALVICLIWKYKVSVVRVLCTVECLAIVGMSVGNMISINRQLPEIQKIAGQGIEQKQEDIIHLDQKGHNVVVMMLDRAIGTLVPYLFQEHGELQEQFEGFVWYRNTMSYGYSTNTGSPALFGGYDYVPEKMEARTDVKLVDKHNEALKIMPVNFLKEGYEVTVCDPPYANYSWIPDLSIFDEYPEIRRFNTEGMFEEEGEGKTERYQKVRNRNFFCYSLFRIAPVLIHAELYDNGNYNEADMSSGMLQRTQSLSVAQGINYDFLDSYPVLENLIRITQISETGKDHYFSIANHTTHAPTLLQEPAYEPKMRVDNRAYDAEHSIRYSMDGKGLVLGDLNQMRHYQINMASYLQIARWLEYLKEEGVYDNTRIIIVSDHGWDFGNPVMDDGDSSFANVGYNPVLLVKDFNRREPFRIDESFMTNGDVPTLAFEGLISNPYNPFLNKEITDEDKQNREQKVCIADFNVNSENVSFNGDFFSVDPETWRCH